MLNKKSISDFSMAFTLALGFGVLIILIGVGLTIARQGLASYTSTTATLTKDGEVMVIHRKFRSGSYRSHSYVGLSGETMSSGDMYAGSNFLFWNAIYIPGNTPPRHWSQRIAGFQTNQYWYLVRGAVADTAYFVSYGRYGGIDGYLGKNGYQTSQPTGDELLTLSNDFHSNYLAGARPTRLGMMNNSNFLFLATNDEVLEIDFPAQKVETFAKIKSATGIARRSDHKGIIIRDEKNLYVFDDDGTKLATLESPPNQGVLTVFPYAENKFAINTYSGMYQNFFWYEIGDDPNVVAKPIREESIEAGNAGLAEIGPVEVAATAASSPIFAFFAPTLTLKIAACVLPFILASFTWRLEDTSRRKVLWATFSLVLGLSGFLGYWFHRKRTETLLSCLQCNEAIAKPKTACQSCHEPLPLPARLGTEIFA